jgi:hypothetical protein
MGFSLGGRVHVCTIHVHCVKRFNLDIALFDRILVDFELLNLICVCVDETVEHLIWHCERFWLERHRLIDAIPVRNLCALKKWCAVKCCLDILGGFEIKL